MHFNKFLKVSIVFLVIFSWIFSGWPQIWQAELYTGLTLTAIFLFATLTIVNPPRPKVRLSAGFLFW